VGFSGEALYRGRDMGTVEAALASGARTRDLSATAEKPLSTSAMGDAVVAQLG
jgi:hypothetical protein